VYREQIDGARSAATDRDQQMTSHGANGRRRVVIIGGGFGGIAAAKELRQADVEVTVVDRMNHHLFQPLLYQVATGALSSGDCATPIRGMLKRQRNATVLMAEAKDVDVERKAVVLDRGELLDYDSLIVACGAETSYFGHDNWSEVSSGLKTLADAVDLRDRIFGALEEGERRADLSARAEWLTFVVVGGGPTGVEIAGQLAVILHHQLKRDFRRIDPVHVRVILLDAGDRVVAAFSKKLSARAGHALRKLGVQVREHARVIDIDTRGVTVEVGGEQERIAARTVIWAAGVRSAGVANVVARATSATTDRAGRIEVGSNLTIPGHPEISVIGDVACVEGPGGRALPGLATVAIQQGRHTAQAICDGDPGATTPFKYFDKGALAVVGRGRAICQVRGIELYGPPAFLTYLGVHLYYLSGVGGRRLEVLMAWATSGLGALQNRVIERHLEAIEPPPGADPGLEITRSA
jgi:NADH:ubiquinone reductase (H+-translocating)